MSRPRVRPARRVQLRVAEATLGAEERAPERGSPGAGNITVRERESL